MNQPLTGRMLLSHNYQSSEEIVPSLDRAAFADVFIEGLQSVGDIECRVLPESSPHWLVEVLFADEITPHQVGEQVAKTLAEKRKTQRVSSDKPLPDTLVLGGLKSTPATSPTGLQPGEWGVDIVEVTPAAMFLELLDWDKTVAQRSPDTFFKVEILGK